MRYTIKTTSVARIVAVAFNSLSFDKIESIT